ncbi:MAG TPA: serine/threonine-protein kinase [Polyangiaceae bacterium]|nr:serine/threonine-protein kinase [Polyangiaceae bacterium]
MTDRHSNVPGPTSLSGQVVQSEYQPGVSYRLERRIGEGGMGQAFLALRQAPDGISPVVIKMVRPTAESGAQNSASIIVQKEAVALGRLNERVPPCPFVVRLVDTGSTYLNGPSKPPTPWLAVEYVHGGVEGTTLEDRVKGSIERTGVAFDPARAAHAVKCLASGLHAIHGVGVVHRDLTPGNILCCGFGEAEILKISDFGIARPQGLAATFGGIPVGTLGYAAPEQCLPDSTGTGTFTDIFALACVIYFTLTGETLFESETLLKNMLAIRDSKRRSLLDAQALIPELRQRSDACRAIDAAIARATALDPKQRPQEAPELAASIVPWLTETPTPPKPSRRLINSLINLSPPGDLSRWEWTVRHPGGDRIIRSAAWDTDGHCFAFTTTGPAFWNGQMWVDSPEVAQNLPAGLGFARRLEAGSWLVGGAGGQLAVYATDGVRAIVRAPSNDVTFTHASGRFDDLLTAVGQRPGEPPSLWAMAARRWLKPMPLDGVAYVAALLRLDDSRWVICGRLTQGAGFAAIYSPMQWETTYLLTPRTRAFVAGASESDRGLGLVVGSEGVALRVEGNGAVVSIAEGAPDLTAAAMDVLDREWVASLGKLWVRDPARDTAWRSVWSDPRWQAPFISIMADAGMLVAMTADGAVLEGRASWRSSGRLG